MMNFKKYRFIFFILINFVSINNFILQKVYAQNDKGGSGSHGGDDFKMRIESSRQIILKIFKEIELDDKTDFGAHYNLHRSQLVNSLPLTKIKINPWQDNYIELDGRKVFVTAKTELFFGADIFIKEENRQSDPKFIILEGEVLLRILLHEFIHHTGLSHNEEEDEVFFNNMINQLLEQASQNGMKVYDEINNASIDQDSLSYAYIKAYLPAYYEAYYFIKTLISESNIILLNLQQKNFYACELYYPLTRKFSDLAILSFLKKGHAWALPRELRSSIASLWNHYLLMPPKECHRNSKNESIDRIILYLGFLISSLEKIILDNDLKKYIDQHEAYLNYFGLSKNLDRSIARYDFIQANAIVMSTDLNQIFYKKKSGNKSSCRDLISRLSFAQSMQSNYIKFIIENSKNKMNKADKIYDHLINNCTRMPLNEINDSFYELNSVLSTF